MSSTITLAHLREQLPGAGGHYGGMHGHEMGGAGPPSFVFVCHGMAVPLEDEGSVRLCDAWPVMLRDAGWCHAEEAADFSALFAERLANWSPKCVARACRHSGHMRRQRDSRTHVHLQHALRGWAWWLRLARLDRPWWA